jgi:hypothetical protein
MVCKWVRLAMDECSLDNFQQPPEDATRLQPLGRRYQYDSLDTTYLPRSEAWGLSVNRRSRKCNQAVKGIGEYIHLA